MRYGILLSSLVVACLLISVAQAQQPTFSTSLESLRAALMQNDLSGAAVQARTILDLAAKADQTKLTGPEMYAIGAAHLILGSATMQQASQMGGLDAEMQRNAVGYGRMFMRPATAQPQTGAQLPATIEQTPTAAQITPVKMIGKGQEVNLEEHLVPGKTTIVDFYSDFCGPCKQLAPRLEALVTQRQDIAVVKVDINRPGQVGIDWQSPVARQFNLTSIPYLRIYGPDGKLQAEGRPAMVQVIQWCQPPQ
ncbi:MAG: thioredoxin family protein [Armatimonadia bacterium]